MNEWHVQEQYNSIPKGHHATSPNITKININYIKCPGVTHQIMKFCPTSLGLEEGKYV